MGSLFTGDLFKLISRRRGENVYAGGYATLARAVRIRVNNIVFGEPARGYARDAYEFDVITARIHSETVDIAGRHRAALDRFHPDFNYPNSPRIRMRICIRERMRARFFESDFQMVDDLRNTGRDIEDRARWRDAGRCGGEDARSIGRA